MRPIFAIFVIRNRIATSQMLKENYIKIFEESFKKNWNKPALHDYISGHESTYEQMCLSIARHHILFKYMDISQGDRIALCGKNSSRWAVTYMAAITYGAVIVPILDEFTPNDITHIINHSESRLLFCDEEIFDRLNPKDLPSVKGVLALETRWALWQPEGGKFKRVIASINAHFKRLYPDGFAPDNVKYADRGNDQLAVISYTSGTTSLTKGVMISGNALTGNVLFGIDNYERILGKKLVATLCVLPLSHTYATAFNLLVQLASGARITMLGRIPSPNIVIKACKETKPTILCFVPLVMEKIYKVKIAPVIKKPLVSALLKTPVIGSLMYKAIGRKLYAELGGSAYDIIIGGAAFNPDIEAFFHKTGLPFTVGYGMTECAPLISYSYHKQFVPGSVGRPLPGLMEVRIDKETPDAPTGEIMVKGENVMLGYYKNEEATSAAFTGDGWMHTGDLGYMDADDNIFIKGRSKTMLLGSNGENIYPEVIESKLDNLPLVAECIVLQKGTRLIALVHPDYPTAEQMRLDKAKIPQIMNDNLKTLNSMLARYEQISSILISENPFPMTPKRTVKRYLVEKAFAERPSDFK